jgi:hypothetical protein
MSALFIPVEAKYLIASLFVLNLVTSKSFDGAIAVCLVCFVIVVSFFVLLNKIIFI